MKLKYLFEVIEMGDQVVAVPVGDTANEFHGIVKLNSTGAEILNLIQDEKSEKEIVDELSKQYESTTNEIESLVFAFFNQLKEAGLSE